MATFFTSIIFKYFVVPLLTVFLSVFVKAASKNDRYATFRKEDLAVGLEIALIAMVAFIAYCVSLAHQISSNENLSPETLALLKNKFVSSPWLIAFFVIGLWGVSTLVRKLGWKSKDELSWIFGIICPFVYGIVSLIFVVSWMGS